MGSISPIQLADAVCDGYLLDRRTALSLHATPDREIPELLAGADRIRRHFKGNKASLCSIVNAKSGRCTEDCAFCSQSVRHNAAVAVYPLLSSEEIATRFNTATAHPIDRFGIVTSGKGIRNAREMKRLCETIRTLASRNDGIDMCASLGVLSKQQAVILKQSGLDGYHHNIESSRRFFPRLCSTHEFDERVRTVRIAKESGFTVCCGGIFGVGENVEDRVDMALHLRELAVDSVPLNFLVPIPGTKLAQSPPLQPLEILKIIALFRYVLPEKDIRVCGGRERNLRDLQCLVFSAGANGIMLGNYLTTAGRRPEDDLQLLSDLGLEPLRS